MLYRGISFKGGPVIHPDLCQLFGISTGIVLERKLTHLSGIVVFSPRSICLCFFTVLGGYVPCCKHFNHFN